VTWPVGCAQFGPPFPGQLG